MNFKEAYEALKQGAKIKRPHWRGYWVKENGTITMYCKDGSVIPFLETDDIFVDLDNIVADDWELFEDCDVKDLNITTFTFGEALSNLKKGNKVARKEWNGNAYVFIKLSLLFSLEEKGMVKHLELFAKTSDGKCGAWNPNSSDCLAEDWMLVE